MAIRKGYVTEDTEGKLYRVRDKCVGKGKEYIVWASNLTYADAHALKEKICGAEKSRTARIEEMTEPLPADGIAVSPKGEALRTSLPGSLVTASTAPDPDATLQATRARALAAARSTTAQAQARADALVPPNGESEAEMVVPDNIEDQIAEIGDLDELA